MKLSLEMTTSHPHLLLREKETKQYFILCRDLRKIAPLPFSICNSKLENDPKDQEVSDKNAYKEVKVLTHSLS